MKILVAEDDPISQRVLQAKLLEWGYDVTVASDGGEAWAIMRQAESPSLVISDWMMPGMDGLTLCRKIRQMERPGYIYFIILTAKKGVVEALEAGADDFLTKPFNPEELKCRIRIGERILNLERRILELANTDMLTGLLNRRAFMEKIRQEISRTQREKRPLSLIMADIDHFKRINDAYGHQAGDLVLQRFAEQLTASTRPYDFTGRYGGEEFIVCLPGTGRSGAGSIAERIRRQTEDMEIMLPDESGPIRITASFGTASHEEGPRVDVDLLIKRADEALYRAKRGGRNRVCGTRNDED